LNCRRIVKARIVGLPAIDCVTRDDIYQVTEPLNTLLVLISQLVILQH